MPGTILAVQGAKIAGCAWHPRYCTYPVVVHAVVGSVIAKSAMANETFEYAGVPKERPGHGFILDLSALDLSPAALARTRVLIAETDESLDLSPPEDGAGRAITIEEIVDLPFRRRWITGRIYFDALLAGSSLETVIDLSYRDFFGRPADVAALAHYVDRLREGSLNYEEFRQDLLAAPEYALRDRRAHDAPGAIFSRPIVAASGSELETRIASARTNEAAISARVLLAMRQIDFIAEAYRRLIGEPPPAGVAWRYLGELRRGRQRLDILRELAADPRALRRNIRFADPAEEEAAALEPLPRRAAAGRNRKEGGVIAVSATDLLALDGESFVEESWQRILGRVPSADEAALLGLGLGLGGKEDKREILEYLAGDPEALARNVRLAAEPDGRRGADHRRRTRPAWLEANGREVPVIAGLQAALAQPRNAAAPQVPSRRQPPMGYEPFGDRAALDGPFVGVGFYAAETNGAGNWWRWTGPGRQVQIRLPVAKPGGYRVAIWCEHAPAAALEHIEVRCCGEAAKVRITRRAGSASLICEVRTPKVGFVGWLDLELRHGPPKRSADGRMLGLCIGSIAVAR